MSDHPPPVDQELKELTNAIMGAMGIKSAQEQKVQSASIFLSKLFKKYSNPNSPETNDYRLNRLNAFFYKVFNKPPTEEAAMNVIKQMTISFIKNQTNINRGDDFYPRITCKWVSQILEMMARTPFFNNSIIILKQLLKKTSETLITSEKLEELIKSCSYFNDMEILSAEEEEANKNGKRKPFLTEFEIITQILQNIKTTVFFSELFARSTNKKQIMQLFLSYCGQCRIEDITEKFIEIFIHKKDHSPQTVLSILTGLDSPFFDDLDFEIIVKVLIEEIGVKNRKILFKPCLKGLNCEKRYHQILLSQINVSIVDELAQLFISEKKVNNYYLLFLMNKSTQKISNQFVSYLFTEQKLNKRQAIIISLWVTQHQNGQAFRNVINSFLELQEKLSMKQKINVLKIIYLSLLRIPKSHLLTQVIKNVSSSDLDEESSFEFLNFEITYEKTTLKDAEDQRRLSEALNRYYGNSDEVYRLKVELNPVCGRTLPFMKILQQITQVFEKPLDEIVETLPNLNENLLEIVMMGLNNRLNEQFLLGFENNQKLLDWALSQHKKETKKFLTEVDQELKRLYSGVFQNVLIEIMEYNLISQEQLSLDQIFMPITSISIIHRLEELNFSQYFISASNDKVEKYTSILKPKSIIIELRKFIKFMASNAKYQGKKQLKTIIAQDILPLRALKIIDLLTKIPNNKFKNYQVVKNILEKLMGQLKPQFQFFDLMESKAVGISVQYVSFYDNVPFLLENNYPVALDFISKLMKSKIPTTQKKKKVKRNNAQTGNQKTDKQKLIAIICRRMKYIFGDPSSLQSYKNLTSVINEIAKPCDPIQLANEITKWMGQMKIFHRSDFKQWHQKVINLIELYQFVCPLILKTITHSEIERHFMMLTDLLNTLYERFKKQEMLAQIQSKLLKGLYILYRVDCIKSTSQTSQMQEQEPLSIPYDKINDAMEDKHLDLLADPHIYYCFDCCKTVCHNCVKIHRLHDINYSGSGNQKNCHRSRDQREANDRKGAKKPIREKERDRQREREREQQRLFYGGGGRYFDPDQSRKSLQKFLLAARNLEDEEDEDQFIQRRRLDFGLQLGNERSLYESLRARQLQEIPHDLGLNRMMSKNSEGLDEQLDDKAGESDIKSCSDKDFLIKDIRQTECGCGRPVFKLAQFPIKKRKSKINLTPLYNLFIRELKNNSFIEESSEGEKGDESSFKAKVETEKIVLFRTDAFKNIKSAPNQGFDIQRIQNSSRNLLNRKNVMTIGDKNILMTSNIGGQIISFSLEKIKHNFLIKEGDKRSKDDNVEGRNPQKLNMSIAPVNQISFAPGMKGVIAMVGINKITFDFFHPDGKSRTFATSEHCSNNIQRFQWVKAVKGVFTYLTKDISIMKLGRTEIERKMKIHLNKPIKDYGVVTHGYKLIYMTILDNTGKLYRGKIDFHDPSTFNTDFTTKMVNMDYSLEKFISITCYASFVICTQKNGALILLNLNEDNTLLDEPYEIPILQPLKKHQVASEYPKCKEYHKIIQTRVITRNQSQIFLACLLMKENADETKEGGNLTILSINIRKKKTSVLLFNDSCTTGSYDFTPLSDKDFLFVCMQEDGEIWSYRFISARGPPPQHEYKIMLSPNKIGDYAKDIGVLRVMENIEFFDSVRVPSFKLHPKITDKFKRVQERDLFKLIFEQEENKRFQFYPTGIEMGVVYPANHTQPISLQFTFLEKEYRYIITRSRQIQIPLTIKQVLTLFFAVRPIQIQFKGKSDLTIKDETVYGLAWDQKSPFCEVMYSICKLISIYIRTDHQTPEQFFLNQNKSCIGQFRYEEIEKMLARKNYSNVESNLLMKLQFLRESIPENPITDLEISQLFESIRNNILPICITKNELRKSVEKLCKKFSTFCSNQYCRQLSHPLNYITQFDIYICFKLYEIFRNQQTIQSFQNVLRLLQAIINSRTINAYMILSLSPNIIRDLTQFFRRILIDYKSYFKTNEYGLERDEKKRLFTLCQKLLRLICENYQLNKNKKIANPEENLLKTLEGVFCINKKEFYRDVDLNPFMYFQQNFPQMTYIESGFPIDLLKLEEVPLNDFANKLKQGTKNIEAQNMEGNNEQNANRANIIENEEQNIILRQMAEAVQDDMNSDDSYIRDGSIDEEQEHKMAEEQNRQMEDEYYMRKEQDDGNYERMLDEDEEDDDDRMMEDCKEDHSSYQQLMIQSSSNLDKIYDYLKKFVFQNGIVDGGVNSKPFGLLFEYHAICENLLIEVFSKEGYLTLDNSVFYVTLVYNLMAVVEKKLRSLNQNYQNFSQTFEDSYVFNRIIPLMQVIDSAIDKPAFSILFLGINSFIQPVPTNKKQNSPFKSHTLFLQCMTMYYERFCSQKETKFSKCISSSKWHPVNDKVEAKLSSVIRLQYFDLVNPIYQLKFVGGIYQYMVMNNEKLANSIAPIGNIKDTVLKAVVKYKDLRVFQNIMLLKKWGQSLETTKIDVAFQKIELVTSNPTSSSSSTDAHNAINMIKESINKHLPIFVNSMQENPERIQKIQALLGMGLVFDEQILQILNSYYEASFNSNIESPQTN